MFAPHTKSLIAATDAGREGELIFRYIYEHARCRKPWQRLWLSSLTPAAIRSDTENVAKDIDSVEQGFGRFTQQIADFRSTTSEFVSKFAA